MTNAWVERARHIMTIEHCSFKQALQIASKTYKKSEGGAIKASTLAALSKNSYKGDQQFAEKDGYTRDNRLSGKRVQVYHNDETGHTTVVHKGTQGAKDWGTDLAMSVGLLRHTKRYKHAKKIQKAAEKKYGRENVSTIGHSLGARLAQTVGKNSKEVISINRPVLPSDVLLGRRTSSHQYDVRTSGDPVSALSAWQKRRHAITIKSTSKNPLTEHSVDTLDRIDGDKMIGRGIGGWVAHCKAYAAKHGCSYRDAMRLGRDSWHANK